MAISKNVHPDLLAEMLANSFGWSASAEGAPYWVDVRTKLKRVADTHLHSRNHFDAMNAMDIGELAQGHGYYKSGRASPPPAAPNIYGPSEQEAVEALMALGYTFSGKHGASKGFDLRNGVDVPKADDYKSRGIDWDAATKSVLGNGKS